MQFKNFELIIDGEHPSLETAKDIVNKFNEMNPDYHYYNERYLMQIEVINDRFLWFYGQYDNEKLYGEKIFDIEQGKPFDNTRNPSHIELKKQLFAMYDCEKEILYMNDFNKKSFMREYIIYLCEFKDVSIKNIYASLEEFQNSVRQLKKVKFVQRRDMLTMAEDKGIFSPGVNIYGFDMPQRYYLQMEYDNPISNFKMQLRTLEAKRKEGLFEEIVIVGTDDYGIEQSFNFSTLMKKVSLNTKKNQEERYNEGEVKRELIEELERNNV